MLFYFLVKTIMKKILLLSILLFLGFLSYSQSKPTENSESFFNRKLSIGLDFGYPIYNYNNQLKRVFKNQNFNESTPCIGYIFGCSSSITTHPHSTTLPYLGIDISYLLPNMKEIGLKANVWGDGDVIGHHERYKGFVVTYKKSSYTPYYRFATLTRKFQFDIGVSANFLKFHYREDDQKYFRPGVFIGGNLSFIEKRSHYLRLNCQANLMTGTVKVGSYDVYFIEEDEMKIEQGFEVETLWLPEVILSLSYGRKF